MKTTLSLFLIAIFSIAFIGSSSSAPSICDCLTNPEYANYGDSKYEQCQEVFLERYGTSDPSTDTMRSDYYACKN